MIALSVILPVYNDAQALAAFLPVLCEWLGQRPGRQEVIVVNDGSRDAVDAACRAQQARLPAHVALRFIAFSRNFGKEAALSAGLAAAQGDWVAMMDADGQHPVPVLAQMLQLGEGGADMVAAIQAERPHEGGLMRLLKRGFYRFMQDGSRYALTPDAGDFRVLGRKVVNALLALPERQRFMKGLYAWVGFKTVYLPFQAAPRQTGESKYNYPRLFELAIVGITSFSLKPLRWISRTGILVSLASLFYGIWVVLETLFFGRDVPGWTTVTAGIMFCAGVQLICLGIIGEYIGRIFEEVKQRPLYLVADEWRGDADANHTTPHAP